MDIHSPNAPLANATVMRARRPKGLASRAHRPLFVVVVAAVAAFPFAVVQIREVHARLRDRHGARIGEDRLQMGHTEQKDDRIEGDDVHWTPYAANAIRD